jgi:hypothetical protein
VLPCLLALPAACALPRNLEDPRILVAPYYASYQLRGTTALQSPGAPPVDNAALALTDFALREHGDDFGIRADIGDDFASFRVDYCRLDQDSSGSGLLPGAWGALQPADQVRMETVMDEFRVGYVGEALRQKFGERERQVEFRFGVGAVVAFRDLVFRVREDTGARTQNVSVDDRGTIHPAARARVSWRGLFVEGEYAISPEWSFGGDFDGTQQDIEVRIGYAVPLQDVSVFGGWRRSEWELDGTEAGLRHRADLVLEGFQFGIQLAF